MMKTLLSICAAVSLVSVGCKSTGSKDKSPSVTSEESSDLTWTEAAARSARVSNVAYDLFVDLSEKDDTFSGKADIQFDLKDVNAPLRLDFFEGTVTSLNVNGQAVPVAEAKKKYWILLPAAALKVGRNQVTVDYSQAYSKQGQGLHKFTDPQTKEVFLYSQFETFDANRFMPCFDQPDLRAPLTMRVEAPAKWSVITATRETSVKPAKDGRKVWTFPKTLPIATYLYSLHAGPYKVWTDKYQNIPLRIYARPSMAKYVRVNEWFTVTKQGLKFFENFFGFKYPFKKYDQLFVPEFNAGAMENVGAVTFTENYLGRSEPTRQQRMGAMGTLLHEMAHMWFGDTVTMKWWNDLWLNESFASYMATLALKEATQYKEAWQDFFASEKQWAYWEDGLVTTHPIEGKVDTVKEAFAAFDGITYGKGASVLNQLRAYMTPESFKKGIQRYIAAHAMKNAELKDFIAALQTETKRDLNVWADRWLRQSGTDKITAVWNCNGSLLNEITLNTTPSAGAQFRPQALTVALMSLDKNGKLGEPVTVRAEVNQPSEKITGNWTCPDFVYPNYGDDGYVSVKLDPVSLEFVKKNLSGIQDLLLRTMAWDALWQMVRATEMPLKDYVAIVDTHFPKENNDIILESVSATISTSRFNDNNILNYWPKTEAAQKQRQEFIVKIENQYMKRFQAAKPGSDEQKLWFDNYVGIAQTPAALDHLAKWARQDKVAPGFPLDLDRRWYLTRQLSRYRHPEATAILNEVKAKDTSDRGLRSAMAVEAIQPDVNIKSKWVSLLKQPKPTLSYAEVRAVSNALFPAEQKPLVKAFEKDFYEYLKQNGASENEIFVETVAARLAPLTCEPQGSASVKKFVDSGTKFVPSIAKMLKVSVQEDERCQKIRAASSL